MLNKNSKVYSKIEVQDVDLVSESSCTFREDFNTCIYIIFITNFLNNILSYTAVINNDKIIYFEGGNQ